LKQTLSVSKVSAPGTGSYVLKMCKDILTALSLINNISSFFGNWYFYVTFIAGHNPTLLSQPGRWLSPAEILQVSFSLTRPCHGSGG
jgi:hypothetical protein